MRDLKSEGKCIFCNTTYSSSGISRHLTSHLKKLEKESQTKKKTFHLKVVGYDLYFLHLLVGGQVILGDLDAYLRKIWLECCGHLSSFNIKGANKKGGWFFEDEFEEGNYGLGFSKRLDDLFSKGLKLDYEYDFGSTTKLDITVMNEYAIESKGANKILLLSRNEPLKHLCDKCDKKRAEFLCFSWHEGGNLFCEDCAEIHTEECEYFDDGGEGGVVNSPRMGVCAYLGGVIDMERDGL